MIDFDEFMTSKELEAMALALQAQNNITSVVAHRLAKRMKQAERDETDLMALAGIIALTLMTDVRTIQSDISKEITTLTENLNNSVQNIAKDTAEYVIERDKPLFVASDKTFVPYENNVAANRIVEQSAQQAQQTITGILKPPERWLMNAPNGNKIPIPQAYRQHINDAILKISAGTHTYDEAIRDTVRKFTEGGITRIFWETPGKRPYNQNIVSAIRREIMTAVINVAGQMSIQNIIALDYQLAQVSKHDGARHGEGIAGHINWQGGVYYLEDEFFIRFGDGKIPTRKPLKKKYKGFIETTGYGDSSLLGLHGYFCRHSFGGWSEDRPLPNTEEELKAQAERDKATTFYKWRDRRGVEHSRDFTLRDALDRQRELENQQRRSRSLLNAYKAAGNKQGYEEELGRYRHMETEYRVFSRHMGIDMQRKWITMDGLGRMLNWDDSWSLTT